MSAIGILKSIAIFIAIIVALLATPLLFMSDKMPASSETQDGMPWQVDVTSDGNSRVFGLMPGHSTLSEARQRLGTDCQVALIMAPGEVGSVEAYYESINIGMLSGKMILTLDTAAAQREEMLKRARKAEYMNSSTRRIELADTDLAALATATVGAITFIPAASLDEQIILQRFGQPAERIRNGESLEHFLYPGKGLEIRLDPKGKEVLQYVAPRMFARLRDPLVAAATSKPQ